jgi:putative hydrolase of HD superfamily
MNDRLERQLDFIRELDRLKNVRRQTWLIDASRQENSAEHSWHIALMAMVLGEYAPGDGVDLGRVLQMLLVHDIVEIDAGDTFCYDEAAVSGQHAREQAAARRLFGLLPADIGKRFSALWEEFEARQTPEARLANALDRLQPVLNNYHSGGKSWQENGITHDQVVARNRVMAEGAPTLWGYVQKLLERAVAKGILPPSAS